MKIDEKKIMPIKFLKVMQLLHKKVCLYQCSLTVFQHTRVMFSHQATLLVVNNMDLRHWQRLGMPHDSLQHTRTTSKKEKQETIHCNGLCSYLGWLCSVRQRAVSELRAAALPVLCMG